ncbi:MAG: photolyase FAD-binding protein [Myxococcaceae bacterium]|nr:photolyase FAD-binding protein [Myxococcaceae bacterium]
MHVPASRVRALNDAAIAPHGKYVLYWMVAARRPRFNFALEQAVGHARRLKLPLLIFEPLRASYPWASERLHTFVVQGMAANAAYFANKPVHYYPYLEPKRGAGAGLLAALAREAAQIVTDDYPCFFIPRMIEAAARALPVAMEAVDGNGILPLSLAEGKTFYNAYIFRRFVQRHAGRELEQPPREDPLRGARLPRLSTLATKLEKRWPRVSARELSNVAGTVAKLPVSTAVSAVSSIMGGHGEARRVLQRFVEQRLCRYEERSHPDADAASGLSPYLHFGHLGVHEIAAALREPESWDGRPRGLARDGKRSGFWGLSAPAEAFLEELVTFRELGFNTAATLTDFDRYESLPSWAQKTLEAHAGDVREHTYSLRQFEHAETRDPVWNAAQTQLRHEGRIQNYLRMLWGKQILQFSKSPREALEIMIELNNRYALDGRDPNSYAGIFWILGRYDRPWAPERPVLGTVRYLSSASTQRKLRLKDYLARHAELASDSRQRSASKKLIKPE